MTENQLNFLRSERDRLLDAWRTAEGADKMAILVRIEDIDEQLKAYGKKTSNNRGVLPRRFFRR